MEKLAADLVEYLRAATYRQSIATYQFLQLSDQITDQIRADVALNDRYYLLTELLNQPHARHPWLYERCREVEADTDGYLDLWARGHYKSTIITFAGTIQEILKDPEITIAIFSHTAVIAKAFLSQIKNEFEQNEVLKRLYPDVLYANPSSESPRWTVQNGIVVKRKTNPKESTLDAWGLVDGQPTSKHYRLRIYDDVVTLESVSTPDQIEKTNVCWEMSQNLGSTSGADRRWHIGTRYNYADTYQVILDRNAVKPRIYAATDTGTIDGKPVFLSKTAWAEKVRDTSTYTLACQQLQNPGAAGNREFEVEWLRYYEIRPKTLNVYIMCDYAGGRNTGSSNTAMMVVGVDAQLNKYLLDGACHKMNLSDRWETLKRLRKKWVRAEGVQIVKVGYERFGAQSDIEHFTTMMQIENEHFPIEELNWPRDGDVAKDSRIRRLQPDLKNWRFFFPYDGDMTTTQRDAKNRGQEYLIAKPIKQVNQDKKIYDLMDWFTKNEYLFFPNTTMKDMLDALSRIYDMNVSAPVIYEENSLEPEVYAD